MSTVPCIQKDNKQEKELPFSVVSAVAVAELLVVLPWRDSFDAVKKAVTNPGVSVADKLGELGKIAAIGAAPALVLAAVGAPVYAGMHVGAGLVCLRHNMKNSGLDDPFPVTNAFIQCFSPESCSPK